MGKKDVWEEPFCPSFPFLFSTFPLHFVSFFLSFFSFFLVNSVFSEGISMSQLLRGISVFVGSKEEPFLEDFVKSGSLSTVLDLLALPEVSEDDKQDSLNLLLHILD
jgi:hypothetical protein